MTPLELAYFTGDNSFVLEIKTIAPVDKNNTRIAWIIASGVHTENRYLNSVLKEAGKFFLSLNPDLSQTNVFILRYQCSIFSCNEKTSQRYFP